MRRPGDRVRAWAASVFDAKTMAQVIDPVVADWQLEWFRAANRGSAWQTRQVLLRGYISFIAAVVDLVGRTAIRAWIDDTPDRQVLRKVMGVAGIATAFIAFVLEADLLTDLPRSQAAALAPLALLLLPSTLTVAIPTGLLVGQLWTSDRVLSSWRSSAALLAVALVVSGVGFANAEWLTPGANQAFRSEHLRLAYGLQGITFPPTGIRRGVNEMRLSELYRGEGGELAPSPRRTTMAFHVRIAMAVAPLVFVLAGLGLGGLRQPTGLMVAIVCSMVYVGYFSVLTMGHPVTIPSPPLLAAWIPNLLLASLYFVPRRAY